MPSEGLVEEVLFFPQKMLLPSLIPLYPLHITDDGEIWALALLIIFQGTHRMAESCMIFEVDKCLIPKGFE